MSSLAPQVCRFNALSLLQKEVHMLRKALATLAAIILLALSIGMSSMSASAETVDDPTRSSIPAPEKGAPTPDNPEVRYVEIRGMNNQKSISIPIDVFVSYAQNAKDTRDTLEWVTKLLLVMTSAVCVLGTVLVSSRGKESQFFE